MLLEIFNTTILLLQQLSVYLVITYLLSKTKLFYAIIQITVYPKHKIICYFIFSFYCILGSYLGLQINGSIANTRAIATVLGGIFGGPIVGFFIGLTAGIHRYCLGGITATGCAIGAVVGGLLGGLAHYYCYKNNKAKKLYNPMTVGIITFVAVVLEFTILLVFAYFDNPQIYSVVKHIFFPMLITNSCGAVIFILILNDRRTEFEKYTNTFSKKALKIAATTEGFLREEFNQVNCTKVAEVIFKELDVAAVAITDRDKILAFLGQGEEHHQPGTAITSINTKKAIKTGKVVHIDGVHQPYKCSISDKCILASSLVIPLLGENNVVIGTIKLYETPNKLINSINRTFGEGIAAVLSNQIISGKNETYKKILSQTELKLLYAQINPHFLFNALNSLIAVIRIDPIKAQQLVQNLSTFFRNNLKQPDQLNTLQQEIAHVMAYLEIEKIRFYDRLQIEIDIPTTLLNAQLPVFSLQPIVENAIKHGISQTIGLAKIRIVAYQNDNDLIIEITDNAGLYQEQPQKMATENTGLGINLVNKRINLRYGRSYGVKISCQRDVYTMVTISLPLEI